MASYKLSIVTIALSLTIRQQFSVECLRRSSQQGVGQFVPKFVLEGEDRCKPNFNTILERHGTVVCERNRVDVFCRLSAMHERDRQTNRPRNGNKIVAIGEIAYQRCHLIITLSIVNIIAYRRT